MPRLPARRVVSDAFDVAQAAQRAWGRSPLADRVRLVQRVGEARVSQQPPEQRLICSDAKLRPVLRVQQRRSCGRVRPSSRRC